MYRIYLRNTLGQIIGRDDFTADDDAEALKLAAILFDACSDLSHSYEVWQGTRRTDGAAQPKTSVGELRAKHEESLIRCEERLQQSEWAIAKSLRLLERLKQAGDDSP